MSEVNNLVDIKRRPSIEKRVVNIFRSLVAIPFFAFFLSIVIPYSLKHTMEASKEGKRN